MNRIEVCKLGNAISQNSDVDRFLQIRAEMFKSQQQATPAAGRFNEQLSGNLGKVKLMRPISALIAL